MMYFNLLLFATLFSFETQAQEVRFSSPSRQVSLIELYSSEGCSSCPPADRWVASLKGHSKLWREFIPLNFHVDYWNQLGWVDRFSNQSFSQRQRRYAGEWGSRRVYTPGFVKNGEEWRARNLKDLLGPEVGVLKVKSQNGKTFAVSFRAKNKSLKSLKLNYALLGNGLSTQVKYGENSGETLRHEFVVLHHSEKPMTKKGDQFLSQVDLPKNKTKGVKSYSLVTWVTQKGSQRPLQVTGGYLPK